MTTVVDTSVLIDVLCGNAAATGWLRERITAGRLHGSEVTRLEVLAGMRPQEEGPTRALLGLLAWHVVDEDVAERAGEFGRRWLPAFSGIDAADLAIAATADLLALPIATRNVRHFPMVVGLTSPY